MAHIATILSASCVAVTGVAAVCDVRTGHIPDWLTLPALGGGLLGWWLAGGVWRSDGGGSLGMAAIATCACLLVPLLLFRSRAIGGGDVKLFAAIGALLLLVSGIEAQFYAWCAGSLFGLARLAWEGRLFRALGGAMFLLLNPVLPARYKRPVAPETLTKIRFGPAIFAGTLVAVLTARR